MNDDVKLSENGEKELRKITRYFDKLIVDVGLDASGGGSRDKEVQGILIDHVNCELSKLKNYLQVLNGMDEITGEERLYIWRRLVIKITDYWGRIF